MKAGRYAHARQMRRAGREIKRLQTYLGRAIEQVEWITGCAVQRGFVVDRGYRGHNVQEPQILISDRTQGLTPRMKKELRRRSAVEPVIGRMKNDGKLGRNYLLGALGDAINALLCGGGGTISA